MNDEFVNSQIKDFATTLNHVSYQIAELLRMKEELEKRVCDLLGHGDDHRRTYICDKFKITLTTGYNYRLDKQKYEDIKDKIPKSCNPVTEKVSYELDKKMIMAMEENENMENKMLLSEIISKSPKKMHVAISAAV